tara:strand:+ start:3236 stop:3367 length:132 start_codon:yes stop_codon:yes gene_type:complete
LILKETGTACKAVNAGSIPASASNEIKHLGDSRQAVGKKWEKK